MPGTYLAFIMSIYLNLRSSECKDVYPKNHGGNFQIELNEPLRLHGQWEVALAEMTYHAQSFPNIPKEHSAVEVSLKEQLQVYDTRTSVFSIKTWVWLNGAWLASDDPVIPKETQFPFIVTLPTKNYDWEDFKAAMAAITMKQDAAKRVTNIKFSFEDDTLIVVFDATARTCIRFSDDLINFPSLPFQDLYQGTIPLYETHRVKYKKPRLSKEKYLVWPKDFDEEHGYAVITRNFKFPKQATR